MNLRRWRPDETEAKMIRSRVYDGGYEWGAEFSTLLKGATLRLRDTRLEKDAKLPCPGRFALDLITLGESERSDATIYGDSLLDLAALAIAITQSAEAVPQADRSPSFLLTINQGKRLCAVTEVKRTRARIEYEMPNAGTMGGYVPIVRMGWRKIVVTALRRGTCQYTSPISGRLAEAKITRLGSLGEGGEEPPRKLVFVPGIEDRIFYQGWSQALRGGSMERLVGQKFDNLDAFNAEVNRLCNWTRIELTASTQGSRTIYTDKEGRIVLREE